MTAWTRRNVSITLPDGEYAVALIALVVFGLVGLIGLTYSYEQQHKAAEVAQTGQQPAPPERNAEADKPDSAQQNKGTENQAIPWYTHPDAPQWALVVLGVVTLLFLSWQAWETRKSANAALLTAQAATRTLKIQRPVLRTDNWRFAYKAPYLIASFDVLNPSGFAARVNERKINYTISIWQPSPDANAPLAGGSSPVMPQRTDAQQTATLVTSDRPHDVAVYLARLDLDDTESRTIREAYENMAIGVTINGTISYADALNSYTLKVQCAVPIWTRSLPPLHYKNDDENLSD